MVADAGVAHIDFCPHHQHPGPAIGPSLPEKFHFVRESGRGRAFGGGRFRAVCLSDVLAGRGGRLSVKNDAVAAPDHHPIKILDSRGPIASLVPNSFVYLESPDGRISIFFHFFSCGLRSSDIRHRPHGASDGAGHAAQKPGQFRAGGRIRRRVAVHDYRNALHRRHHRVFYSPRLQISPGRSVIGTIVETPADVFFHFSNRASSLLRDWNSVLRETPASIVAGCLLTPILSAI